MEKKSLSDCLRLPFRAIIGICIFFANSCDKNTEVPDIKVLPVLTTVEATSITASSAVSGGDISDAGTPDYIERGVCYSTTANPTVDDTKVIVGGVGTGVFTSNLIGLAANTTYFVRAYAINDAGTAYGEQVRFTTTEVEPDPMLPVLTGNVSNIAQKTVTLNGEVISVGYPAYTERGFCYATTAEPTVDDTKLIVYGTGTGEFSFNLTGLSPNTTYYMRAYAINSVNTAYSDEVSFTTQMEVENGVVLLLEKVYKSDGVSVLEEYEYDDQGRITKLTFANFPYTIKFNYNKSGEIEGIDYGTAPIDFTKTGNTIDAITYGLFEYCSIELNNQGLPVKFNGTTFTPDMDWELDYTDDGDVSLFVNLKNEDFIFYEEYDNKKSPHYSSTIPKWLFFSFLENYYGFVHNPISIMGNPSVYYTYEYNEFGYPTKRTNAGDGSVITFSYKEK